MAKRKQATKVQKRGKLPKGKSTRRSKARKAAPAKAAKPKHAPVKKAARKVKPPAAPVIETVAVEAIKLPADAIIVTEVEETEVRKAS